MARRRARRGRTIVGRMWPGIRGVGLAVVVIAGLASTSALAALPDDRAYERVSPADKNGGNVLAMTRRTRASRAGDAVSFGSLVGFADIPGLGLSADYVAKRTRTGWVTHGITPRQEPQTAALATTGPGDRVYVSEFSDDFTKGVARVTAFPGAPANVATVQNLLLREDLLTPGLGRYQLLTDSVDPIPLQPFRTPGDYRPLYADASQDFGHVVFQSSLNLVAGVSGNLQKLYEWDHGTVRLVGILPDRSISPTAVAGRGISGATLGYANRVISDDGSRIYFNVQTTPAFNTSVFGSEDGQLYLRENAGSTVQVNASERSVPDPQQSAVLWTSSADGRFAFFTTDEQLVDEDTNSSTDLYRFDADATAGQRLRRLSVDTEPGDGTNPTQVVIGTSDDGQRVYFIAEGQLIDGAPIPPDPVSQLIYLWDRGQLKYVGKATRPELSALAGSEIATKTARVTPDGQHLMFMTAEGDQEVPHEQQAPQVYLYSAPANNGAGELTCVSCPPDGSPAPGIAVIDIDANRGAAGYAFHFNRVVSDDGNRVFFTTAQGLVSEDHNANNDVYQYTRNTRTLDLISTGHPGAGDAYFMDASASGDDVFFTTREQLVPADQDTYVDLYDARTGGGFPEPPPTTPCQETCQGLPIAPPPFTTPPSTPGTQP